MTERVLLIDMDSKIPNIALMKISQYHKSRGDIVGFNVEDPTLIYCSIIFNKNKHKADGLAKLYPNAKIDIGGSGYDITKKLPAIIEDQSPDYSIYPDNKTYFGFTTRGCIRACYFCIVHKKEGQFRRLFDNPETAIKSITGGGSMQFKEIQFLDNNILADKSWFMDLTDYLIKLNWKVDFNQGLDVRLLDQEIADRLAQLRPLTCFKFAFDSMSVKEDVLKGIQLLKKAGINTRQKVLFYVYCHDDKQVNDAVERCRILKENGVAAYSMLNRDVKQSPRMRALARWTRPTIFFKIDFDEYDGTIKEPHKKKAKLTKFQTTLRGA